ncbi:MAG: glycyl-radical enzyme activating protein [Planctomycetaceae bacterium]|jgi:pyruvate formate lyase activating enzyme|nr:glycyl-radical enzyme activating protein [Planctomycetaceae bacterium]
MNCIESDGQQSGTVFNIQRFSVHDGPGIRTAVFFKGCPMRCRWCCNPESQHFEPEVGYNEQRCLGTARCGHCLHNVPDGIISCSENEKITVNRSADAECFRQAAAECPAESLFIYGKRKTVAEILDDAEKDAVFYIRSGGGITLSGGEPFAQGGFSAALLREAKRRRFHTAAETAGFVPWETLQTNCRFLDYLFYDIKTLNPAKHLEQTGVPLEPILDNFKAVLSEYPALPVCVRTPVIPDFNDTSEELAEIEHFVAGFPNIRYERLPFHRFGTAKYRFLNRILPYCVAISS